MNKATLLEYDGKWSNKDVAWEAILQNGTLAQTCLIFTSMKVVANMPRAIRDSIIQKFHISPLLMSKVCLELNGFSGSQSKRDDDGAIVNHSYWLRFVVKQTHENLHPGFKRHRSGLEMAEMYDNSPQRPYMPIHDYESTESGWTWYEMCFFIDWTPSKNATVLCFDVPEDQQASIRLALANNPNNINLRDPYAILTVILDEVLSLYDNSVWSLRNHISKWEAFRKEEPDYPLLHEIARHVTHVSESLTVASKSITYLQKQHHDIMSRDLPSHFDWQGVHSHLRLQTNILENLLSRSESNSARVSNEMSLAFHTAAQRDSKTQVRIGREAYEETTAMKTIAILTMTFLPATFVASVFSTTFFHFEPNNGNANTPFTLSGQFWMYWAFAVPLSVLTLALWFFWDGFISKTYLKRARLNS